MKNRVYGILSLLLLMSSSLVLCIHDIEKNIFLREINLIGKHAMEMKIYNMQKKGNAFIPYIEIELKLRDTGEGDTLGNQIVQEINVIDANRCYLPDQVMNKVTGECAGPNNFIFSNTRYWHRQDCFGKYIECRVVFSDKKELEKILYN
jgi:hypothetical protein